MAEEKLNAVSEISCPLHTLFKMHQHGYGGATWGVGNKFNSALAVTGVVDCRNLVYLSITMLLQVDRSDFLTVCWFETSLRNIL